MEPLNRRGFLATSGGALLSSAWLGLGISLEAGANAPLGVLRWRRFVPGDVDAYVADAMQHIGPTRGARLCDVNRLCGHLDQRHGSFYPSRDSYWRADGAHWHGIPLVASGVPMVYRRSQLDALGVRAFPRDVAGFMKMLEALRASSQSGGLARRDTSGDSGWVHWLFAVNDADCLPGCSPKFRPDYLKLA